MSTLVLILTLLPVLIQSVEQFLPKANGQTKQATVLRILKMVLSQPVKLLQDITKHDWTQLATDVTTVLVESANQSGDFTHGPDTGSNAGITANVPNINNAVPHQ
jgi:hypothetical protein